MTVRISAFTPAEVPDGIIEAHGKQYMADGKGGLRALENIAPMKKLQDEQVRRIFGFAFALAGQIARFKGHVYEDLGSLDALMMQEYGLTVGGPKGNRTYATFDGLMKIEVRIQDRIVYGPEMQIAKALFDEVLNSRAADADPLIRSIVTNAFDTDKEGQINRANVFVLLNTKDDDPRWISGQEAIRDAMHVIGSKSYWQDGAAYIAKGVRGTAQIVMDAFMVPHLVVKLTGIWDGGAPAAAWGGNPSDPFNDWKQPLLPTSANSVDVTLGCTYAAGALSGGTAYPSLGLSVDIANKVEFIPLLGGEMVAITDRQMVGKSKMMLSAAQEETWRANILGSQETSLGWRIGTVAGAKVGFFAPRAQRRAPDFEDYKTFLLVATDLSFLARNGNDEAKIWAA